ncbi:MAG: ADP-forming succinate--CoA ligase subunit beta [Bacteroidota bacterium]|nr:ADP-forming succinate--CoA ligase subunit beta [Bacteroidota bacterium]
MNLHEYQGKELLKQFGVKVQEGIVAETVEQAVAAWNTIVARTGKKGLVVKDQIHAGGRGQGGGVKYAGSLDA